MSWAAVAADNFLKRVSEERFSSISLRMTMAEPWLVRRLGHLPLSAERKRAKV